jgi:hypothetical protein
MWKTYRVVMQFEVSTSEAAEIFSVTKKTIAEWTKAGIMVKLRHGVFDLKESLKNWTAYQRCIHEGADDPLQLWHIRQQVEWSDAHPLPPYDGLGDLATLQPVTVERDAAGRIVRVVGENT